MKNTSGAFEHLCSRLELFRYILCEVRSAADPLSVTSEEMREAFRIVVSRKPRPTGG